MLIYASSCQDYFAVHGEAFITSAKRQGHAVKIDMAQDFPNWREKLSCDNSRTFACFLRFMRLPELLEQDDVLVCDIDSIINQPIGFAPCDMALFFRPWMPPEWNNKQVLLTASYWSKNAKPFAERVREILLSQHNSWMDDQAAVWQVYQEMGNQFRILNLSQDFVCFHFDREAPIWTCKGPARKTNETYLARRAHYAA